MSLEARLAARRAVKLLPPPRARRRIRERTGLSQFDVAEVLGVTREAVSYWEHGLRTPKPAMAEKYRALLTRLEQEASSPP
jgi:transcriptional regulator with XRE-family HTH domain